jgi:hypothetical protein
MEALASELVINRRTEPSALKRSILDCPFSARGGILKPAIRIWFLEIKRSGQNFPAPGSFYLG